jgi:hypothetical protein
VNNKITGKGSHSVLINTRAIPDICKKCFCQIWVATVDGFKVKVEPTRLNLGDELKLRAQGRRIFQVLKIAFDFELLHRTAWHIGKDDGNQIVLAEHDCRNPGYGSIEEFFPKSKISDTEEIPF